MLFRSLKDCDWIFFFDNYGILPYNGLKGSIKKCLTLILNKPVIRDLYSQGCDAGLVNKMVLFIWEAPAVCPSNWNNNLHNLFSHIFTWSEYYSAKPNFHKICWPQTRKFPTVPIISYKNKKLLVNISMNKFSKHKRELYTSRKESIRYFEESFPNDFDLYGVGWNNDCKRDFYADKNGNGYFRSYRGLIDNKWEILPNYKFSLCYENIRDEEGFITEKIFDSMRSNCVPIYWGAPNIGDYVDPKAFIDRREFKSNKDLATYLININENDYNKYLEAINRYLISDKFFEFSPEAFFLKIYSALNL